MILRPAPVEPVLPPGFGFPIPPSLQRYFEWIEFEPYDPWQRLYCAAICYVRFVLWLAGARGGKSDPSGKMAPYLCLMKPKTRGWLYGSSYDSAEKEFLYAVEVVEERIPKRIKGFKASVIHNPKQGNMMIRFPNGSWLKAMSAESAKTGKSGKGEELDFLNLCEGADIPYGVWKRILNYRITSRVGRVFGGTTPEGFNWLNDIFFKRSGGDPSKTFTAALAWPGYLESNGILVPGSSVPGRLRKVDNPYAAKEIPGYAESYYTQVSPSYLSPWYPPEEHERHLKEDDDADYQEQVLGVMVNRQGLVIRWLLAGQSLITGRTAVNDFGWHSPTEPPTHWKRVVSMDYGESKPKATLIGAIEPRNRFVVWYWEYYDNRGLIRDQVKAAKLALGWHADRSETRWIVDKSAPLREYREAGAPVSPSRNYPGRKTNIWATTNRMLRDGRCFVLADTTPHLQDEVKNFKFKPDSERSIADERDAVVKKDDHLCDALGYGNDELADELMASTDPDPEVEAPWPPPFVLTKSAPVKNEITDAQIRSLIFG